MLAGFQPLLIPCPAFALLFTRLRSYNLLYLAALERGHCVA